jgi:hypothetical protein
MWLAARGGGGGVPATGSGSGAAPPNCAWAARRARIAAGTIAAAITAREKARRSGR